MAARVVRAVRKHISAAGPAEEETKAVRVVHIDCEAVPLMTASGECTWELEGALQQRFLHEDRGFFPASGFMCILSRPAATVRQKEDKGPFTLRLKPWSDSKWTQWIYITDSNLASW